MLQGHKKVIMQSNARHKIVVIYRRTTLDWRFLTLVELKSVSGSCLAGAVQNISLRLPNGKTYGIFAPNPNNAAALLALLSGARTLASGSVYINGFDLHREASHARKSLGYLPAALLPDDELTVLEYLLSVADIRSLPFEKTVRRTHEMLDLVDLSDKKDRLVGALSHGEKRLLCLLSLLLCDAEILLLDSPLAGVTPRDAQKISALIKHLHNTKTIFLCSPSVRDLEDLCDEIVVLGECGVALTAPVGDDALEAALTIKAAPAPSTSPEKPARARSKRLAMLMQKSGDYEVLDTAEKEED